jgi:hypothetical protein
LKPPSSERFRPALVAATVVAACGGSTVGASMDASTAPPGDASTAPPQDASPGDASTAPLQDASTAPPGDASGIREEAATASSDGQSVADGDASPSTFCADLDARVVQCGYSAQCRADVAATCGATFDARYSDAFKSAFHACQASVSCSNFDPGEDACMFPKIVAQPPTAAQNALAGAFCAACAQGATTTTDNGLSCAGQVVHLSQGYGRVMGVEVLSLSDTAAQRANACIAPAMAAYPNDYLNCENLFLNCLAGLTTTPASCAEP